MHIVGLGFRPHHDDLFAFLLGPHFSHIGIKGHHAVGRSRRNIQAPGQHLALTARGCQGFIIELRVQKEVDMLRGDPCHRFFARDHALFDHVHGNAHRRLSRTFTVAGLQHPELALFNGKLHILHVAVMLFKRPGDLLQLLVIVRHLHGHVVDVLGHANAGDHILALGIDQVVAFQFGLARGAIARHGHTGGAVVAHVSEDHGHDTDCCAQIMGNACRIAIIHRALAIPAFENRFSGHFELFDRILGKIHLGMAAEDGLELPGQGPPMVGAQLGLGLDTGFLFDQIDRQFERLIRDSHDHRPKHLDQAAIGIIHKTRVLRVADHALGGFIIETNVEHGIHHARHRKFGARTARDKQRVVTVAKGLASGFLDDHQGFQLLIPHPIRKDTTAGQIGIAGFGGHREPRRNRHADALHIRQIGTLAPEQAAHSIPIVANILHSLIQLVEKIDPFFCLHLFLPRVRSACYRCFWMKGGNIASPPGYPVRPRAHSGECFM